jgi:hypothetical protein
MIWAEERSDDRLDLVSDVGDVGDESAVVLVLTHEIHDTHGKFVDGHGKGVYGADDVHV